MAMSGDQLACRTRRPLDRLSQPSSVAGLAALLALMMPELAEYAPAIVDVGLMVIAIGAAIVAMVSASAGTATDMTAADLCAR